MSAQQNPAHSERQYRVGCAGEFMMGMDAEFSDLDEALVYAGKYPARFVYGPRGERDACYGPFDMTEIDAAKARVEASRVA